MKSDAYWKQRALRREAESYKEADRTISKVLAAYDRAEEQINSDIKRVYSTFSDKGRLSKNEMDALMSANESQDTLDRLRRQLETIKDDDIRRKALDRLNAKAYAARISRLQAVKTAIQAQTAKIADVQKTAMDEHLNRLTADTYYKSIYDVQIGSGTGFSFSSLPLEVIDSILSEKLYGQDYSSRVWSNTELLAEEAYKVVSSGITAGMSVQRMARQLDEAMDDGRYAAVRLIRTETNRVFNASHLQSYKAMGAKKYRFLATLDAKTCSACGKFDKKVFDIEEAVQGKNYPPLHPNDRCTTMAVIDGMTEKGMQRRAKDPVTGKNVFVPADMTYEQWVKQLNDKYGYDIIKAAQKTKADRLQYRKYKKLLGADNVPKSLEEFQKMKYNKNNSKYAELKKQYLKSVSVKNREMHRKKDLRGEKAKYITENRFNELTIEAKKNGANIIRGGFEVEQHLDSVNAAASIVGDTILFRENVTISEVLEETHHFKQNKFGLNDDKPEPLRTYLNEIEAKQFLISNAAKYAVPRSETQETEKQLEWYNNLLEQYRKEHRHDE